jgi:putative ABC transport system permease protein
VRLPAARLLGGSIENWAVDVPRAGWWRRLMSWPMVRGALVLLSIAMCVAGFFMHGEAQAGIFFTSGAAVLTLLLGEIRYRLRSHRGRPHKLFSLARLSALNTARNPGRSTLTIGLVAAASFLIVAVSAFRLDTGEGGTGGFEFVATSDQPIHYDLDTADGRRELGFSDAASRKLTDWRVYSLRVAAGEDASCLNLYQPRQPRVLGVPAALVQRGGFEWSATAAAYSDKPWTALDANLGRDANGKVVVPAVLDMSTAVYSLHLSGIGSQFTIQNDAGRPVTVEVVGLLENSVLQGNLLVSEASFLRMFPDTGGYRFFLIEQTNAAAGSRVTDGHGTRRVPAILESALAEEGFDVVDAREQLAQFLAVQNTYLSTFQSLGALGLLLGTIGLAVVQLRSVLERRGELALMRAGGFARKRLAWMVVCENAVLLVGGLLVGCIAAAIALIPQWAPHGASVPWAVLGTLVGTITLVGIAAGWLATRSALRAPIVPALRGD